MALSSAQKTRIIRLLGYPLKTLDVGSVLYNNVTADRLENLTSDAEGLVVEILDSVEALDTQIAAAPARFIAQKVGDIELNTQEIEKLRKERKIMLRELGMQLDIPVCSGGGGISVVV